MLRKLNIKSVSGFECSNPETLIFDNKGNVFYRRKARNGKLIFNLPRGVYFTENILTQVMPVNYKIKLPKRDFSPKIKLSELSIIFNKNPHKASINTRTGKIYFNTDLLKENKAFYYFVFFHEIGHLFYKSELNCDNFSTAQLLKLGFNPSQIFEASKKTLSKKNYRRIFNTFKKVNL